MRRDHYVSSGLPLIIALGCTIILLMPGLVSAAASGTAVSGPEAAGTLAPESTGVLMTPAPAVFLVYGNGENDVNPPPFLILDNPIINGLNCTISGSVDPGSENITITSISWDWGDSQTLQYHGFPYHHLFTGPGTYTLSITARQSDGQEVTGITNVAVGELPAPVSPPVLVNISVPGVTGEPVLLASPPVLTLAAPVVDRMNVTLAGTLHAISPGVTAGSVIVDWNDGNVMRSAGFPLAHTYTAPGVYTIVITGSQSDGQSTARTLRLNMEAETPGPAGPAPPADQPVVIIVIITAIVTAGIGVIIMRMTQRKRGQGMEANAKKTYSSGTGLITADLPAPEDLERLCTGTDVTPGVLDSVIRIAGEIAREGREGVAIGTSFVVGDTRNVLNYSRQFVLNPFHGYQEADRQITDVGIRGNIKEFAQLDGAFVISGTGVVEAAGRCITVDVSRVILPAGLGSRHTSVAGITQVTRSIGIVVSHSGGVISVFRDGRIVFTVHAWKGPGPV